MPEIFGEIRRGLTPLRLASVAIALVFVVASVMGMQRHWKQQALRTLRESLSHAEQALQQQEWAKAHQAYSNAVDALKYLGRKDEFSQEISQKELELRAATHLSPMSLAEILEDASKNGSAGVPWESTFRTSIHQRWLVMEGIVRKENLTGSDAWVHLAEPLMIQGKKIDIRWPATLLKQEAPGTGKTQRIFCAGQIESLEQPSSATQPWVLTISPQTAFLWCYEQTSPATGILLENPWNPQQEQTLKQVLDVQRQQMISQESK